MVKHYHRVVFLSHKEDETLSWLKGENPDSLVTQEPFPYGPCIMYYSVCLRLLVK